MFQINKYIIIVGLLLPFFSFAQTTVIDSYSETNNNNNTDSIGPAGQDMLGQSFTVDESAILDSISFYLKQSDSPTGSAYARVYAHTGTYGTSSVPTGSVLATSDAYDASNIGANWALHTFTFSGAERIELQSSTYYIAVIEYTSPNNILASIDDSSPTHSGNWSRNSGSWTAYSGHDMIFYVYAEDNEEPTPTPTAIPAELSSSSMSYENMDLANKILFNGIILFMLPFAWTVWWFQKNPNKLIH